MEQSKKLTSIIIFFNILLKKIYYHTYYTITFWKVKKEKAKLSVIKCFNISSMLLIIISYIIVIHMQFWSQIKKAVSSSPIFRRNQNRSLPNLQAIRRRSVEEPHTPVDSTAPIQPWKDKHSSWRQLKSGFHSL